MVDGLWTIKFIASSGATGAGVLVFWNNRIYGGDARYYYLGEYRVEGETLSVKMEITHFSGEPESVYGRMEFIELEVQGRVDEAEMNLFGRIPNDASSKVAIRCEKRADIPRF